jgi:hypothetical protein
MQQPKFVVVDDGCVESPNGELKGAPHVVDPGDPLETHVVFFRIAHIDVGETLLNPGLEDVGLCDFDVGRMRANAVVGCWRHGGGIAEDNREA